MPQATERPCVQCGRSFSAKRRDARLCSSRCRIDQSKVDRGLHVPERLEATGRKRCGRCREVLDLSEFYWLNGNRKRYQAFCKPCRRQDQNVRARRKRGFPDDAPTRDLRKQHVADGATYIHKRGGYVMEKRRAHHRADRNGWVPQHVLVAEQAHGFPITRHFTVHHRNGVRDDNRPDNLEVRVGNHGKGGDLVDTVLSTPSARARAAEVLRQFGYSVS